MTYETSYNPAEQAGYVRLFDALAGHNLLLAANPPLFTILGATPQRLQDTGLTREEVIGKPLFEVHPGNPNDPSDNGANNLKASLDQVLRYKTIQHLPVQRYDLPNEEGVFLEKYWRASNRPVFNHEGEVAYIIHTAEEITDQLQKAQREIQMEGVEKIFSLFMHAPIVIGLANGEDYVLELANEAAFKLWGKAPHEIIGKPILEGLPELAGQGIIELFDQVRVSRKSFTAQEVPVVSLVNGRREQHYFNLVYQPYYEKIGSEPTGVFTISHDVTEQVLARKKLEENEAGLQKRVMERTSDLEEQKAFIGSILEASSEGIYALKAVRSEDDQIIDFQYLFANDNIATLLKLDKNDVIGSSMLTVLPENRSNGFFDLFCRLIQTGETVSGETHFVTRDIDSWYEYVVVPIDLETVVVSTKDITEKKSAMMQIEEQRNLLDSILKNSSNGISVSKVLRNENGEVIDALTIMANDAAVGFIGLPREIYLTKRATEIEPNIISSPYYQACIQTLNTGVPVMMQYQMEANSRWLELTVSRLDKDHLIHVFTDVTPIKEAQLKLERTVEELKRSNQNLEEFAHAASHDLKEPVRKIHFFTHQLRQQLSAHLNEDEVRSFSRIENATQRMGILIDDLLLYSHVSQRPQAMEVIDLNQKLQRVLEDLDLVVEEKGATIIVNKLPIISGYRRQLSQLFQNLISNAIKYSKEDEKPVIEISAEEVQKEGRSYHLISVRDNGIGFAQEYATKIFQMFTRLHGRNEYSGTGVGLSIVKKVVENHNGTIEAESIPGVGSTFKIYLPA